MGINTKVVINTVEGAEALKTSVSLLCVFCCLGSTPVHYDILYFCASLKGPYFRFFFYFPFLSFFQILFEYLYTK